MPKKKSAKKTKQKFQPFKPTFNRSIVVILLIQTIVIIMLVLFSFVHWQITTSNYNNQFDWLVNESIDSVYEDLSAKSITEYQSGITKWPELGLFLPYENQFEEVYISGAIEDNGLAHYLTISYGDARFLYPPVDGDVYEATQMRQSCSRIVEVVPKSEQLGYGNYELIFNKILKDGRNLDFYLSNDCNPDNVNKFVDHIKRLESL